MGSSPYSLTIMQSKRFGFSTHILVIHVHVCEVVIIIIIIVMFLISVIIIIIINLLFSFVVDSVLLL